MLIFDGRGPLSKVANMIPGMAAMMNQGGGTDADATSRVKKVIYVTDSMTTQELDSDGSLFVDSPPAASSSSKTVESLEVGVPREPNKRMLRVARGSGTSVVEVEEVLAQHKMLSGMVKQFGGLAGMAKAQQGGAVPGGAPGMMPGRGPGGRGMPSQAQIQQMQKSLPPQFQGPGGIAQLQSMARVSLSLFPRYVWPLTV